jgi:hypothetical protein
MAPMESSNQVVVSWGWVDSNDILYGSHYMGM